MNRAQGMTLVGGVLLGVGSWFVEPSKQGWLCPFYVNSIEAVKQTYLVMWLYLLVIVCILCWSFSSGLAQRGLA